MPDATTQKNFEQFTKQAADYSKLTANAPMDRRAALRALLQPTQDDVLLDIACGPGVLTLDLAPHVARVVGVDLTEAMLDQARAAQIERGIANAEWRVADVYALLFEDGAFSIVTCQAAFHHFERPRDVLAEMARVCRAGGRVVVTDVTPLPEKSAAYDKIEIMRDPSHVHAHTLAEVRALAEALPLQEHACVQSMTPFMLLKPILDASRPTEHSTQEIYELLELDARSGADLWGFSAEIREGAVFVAYPMATSVWIKL